MLTPERREELVEQLLVQCDLFEQADLAQKADALFAVALTIPWETKTLADVLAKQISRMHLTNAERTEIVTAAAERVSDRLEIRLTDQALAERIAAGARIEVNGKAGAAHA